MGLALASGLMLGLPWAIPSLYFLMFMAWIPLLALEKEIRHRSNAYAVFNYALVCFLVWNILGTWWVARAQPVGAIFIIVANALVQALVFWLASRVRTILGISPVLSFILMWMGYEYCHEIWDLAWPWLNLGNALATAPGLVQWYEYTGARGGSLWILTANLALWGVYRACCKRDYRSAVLTVTATFLILVGPVLLSHRIYRGVQEEGQTVSFALVQPNLDPYTEKFDPRRQARHLDDFFRVADNLCDNRTQYLFGPETLIVQQIDEDDPESSPHYRRLLEFQKKYPQLNILLGVHSMHRLKGDGIPPGSRFDPQGNFYYEAFNTALFLVPGAAPQFYHKTKLVPLFERMPFVQYLGFLGRFSLELGGYTGTYSDRQAHTIFKTQGDAVSILPIVCFESIFGPYCSRNLPEEKGFIGMITNDGWWKNTPGYQHHFNFSPLRAIENRRDMIRIANTGISALIDARGIVVAKTKWWQAETMKGVIHLRRGRTFFSHHGDFIGRTALFSGICLLLYTVVRYRLLMNERKKVLHET